MSPGQMADMQQTAASMGGSRGAPGGPAPAAPPAAQDLSAAAPAVKVTACR